MTVYTVEGGHRKFLKGRGYFKTKNVPAWRVVGGGKASQLTSVEAEAVAWADMLNAGHRPTCVSI